MINLLLYNYEYYTIINKTYNTYELYLNFNDCKTIESYGNHVIFFHKRNSCTNNHPVIRQNYVINYNIRTITKLSK